MILIYYLKRPFSAGECVNLGTPGLERYSGYLERALITILLIIKETYFILILMVGFLRWGIVFIEKKKKGKFRRAIFWLEVIPSTLIAIIVGLLLRKF